MSADETAVMARAVEAAQRQDSRRLSKRRASSS